MEEAISFFRAFELWIYLLLGLGGLYYLRRFILAWRELQGASFGLERDSAQARLNQSASALVLLLTMAVVEFVLVSFIAPAMPGVVPLPTPTLNLLATATITLPAAIPQPAGDATATPLLIPELQSGSGCIPGQIEITMPKAGEEVSGIVPVVGTANLPNFGFYKFEIKRPSETIWLTIQAGNTPVQSGKLGDWDTTSLSPGDYQLGLVAVDNQAQASQPCVIQVRVSRPVGTPSSP